MAALIVAFDEQGKAYTCDARCYDAAHPSAEGCRCVCCGGRNHGRGLNRARKLTIRMFSCKGPYRLLRKRMEEWRLVSVTSDAATLL